MSRRRAERQSLETNRCLNGKLQYLTPDAAQRVADAAVGRMRFRVYRCEFCRYWHLTTQKKRSAA